MLTPCAFVHSASFLDGCKSEDPWSVGESLCLVWFDLCQSWAWLQARGTFPKSWSGLASKSAFFIKRLLCCPHLMGTIADGGGGVIADADVEWGNLSVPFLVRAQPFFFIGFLEGLPKAKSLKRTEWQCFKWLCVFSPGVVLSLRHPHSKSWGTDWRVFCDMPSGGTMTWQVQVRQEEPFPSLEEKKIKICLSLLCFHHFVYHLVLKIQTQCKIVQCILWKPTTVLLPLGHGADIPILFWHQAIEGPALCIASPPALFSPFLMLGHF